MSKDAFHDRDNAAGVLAIFGISGDLAKKMTFRALYRLEARGKLETPIVGVAIDEWDDEQLRQHAKAAIDATVSAPDEEVFVAFISSVDGLSEDEARARTDAALRALRGE